MTTDPEVPILSRANATSVESSKRGCGFFAVCAGLAVTGLGQAVAGQIHRGLAWFVGSIVFGAAVLVAIWFPTLVPALIILLPLTGLWNLSALIDAYLCGHRRGVRMLRTPTIRYLAGAGIVGLLIVSRRSINPALATAMYVKAHVCEAFVIPGNSMAPTMVARDRILCHKQMAVSRWSIAVIDSPPNPKVKFLERIVGLPGETVQIIDGRVAINGAVLESPAGIPAYTTSRADGSPIHGPGCDGPILLGRDEYYCLGDNSPIAGDSRYWPPVGRHQSGALPASSIVGTATYIYWPPSRWKRLF